VTVEEAAFEWTAFAGRLHPLVLHLPIGLFAGVVVLEVLSWWPSMSQRSESKHGVEAARRVTALVGAASAALAAFCGWWLGEEGGYDEELLSDHRWMSIGFAVLFAGAALLERRGAESGRVWARRGVLAFAGALLGVAGHHGGMLTHGSSFLASKAPAWLAPYVGHDNEAPLLPIVAVADGAGDGRAGADGGAAQNDVGTLAFAALARRCIECHGPDQQKGGLRLDVAADLLSVVEPFDAPASELMRRVLLPASHADFMPSEGEPLRDDEVLALRNWINAGAPLAAVEEARAEVEQAAASREERLASVAAASGALLVPLAPLDSSLGLRADLSRGDEAVDAAHVAALADVAQQIVELSFAGRDIEAGAFDALPELAAVHTLRLERATVAGAPLDDAAARAALAHTPNVERVVLHGTAIGDGLVDALIALPQLAELFVADTRLSAAALARLAARTPPIAVHGDAPLVDDPFTNSPRVVIVLDAARERLVVLREIGVEHHDELASHAFDAALESITLPDGRAVSLTPGALTPDPRTPGEQRLANGHVLRVNTAADGAQLEELDAAGAVVWSFTDRERFPAGLAAAWIVEDDFAPNRPTATSGSRDG
jgi:uncharacterized membrane protein